jgi:hypothetical protein
MRDWCSGIVGTSHCTCVSNVGDIGAGLAEQES